MSIFKGPTHLMLVGFCWLVMQIQYLKFSLLPTISFSWRHKLWLIFANSFGAWWAESITWRILSTTMETLVWASVGFWPRDLMPWVLFQELLRVARWYWIHLCFKSSRAVGRFWGSLLKQTFRKSFMSAERSFGDSGLSSCKRICSEDFADGEGSIPRSIFSWARCCLWKQMNPKSWAKKIFACNLKGHQNIPFSWKDLFL